MRRNNQETIKALIRDYTNQKDKADYYFAFFRDQPGMDYLRDAFKDLNYELKDILYALEAELEPCPKLCLWILLWNG